jgi:TRAP transporter TAXI family solute receptor
MSHHRIAGAIAAATIALFFADSAAAASLTFSTGRQGGSQYPVSVALAQIMEKVPGIDKVTLRPGGGASNIVAVDTGQSDLGITLSISAKDAIDGHKPYKKKMTNFVQLFALHPFKVVVLVNADSPIKTFKDLTGKKVNTGPKGFTITELAERVFADAHMKVNMSYLTVSPAIEQFRDGHLDALFYTLSDRYAPFIDLAQSRKLRLIALPKDIRDGLLKAYPSIYAAKFPGVPGVYKGITETIDTLAYPNIIIANKGKISDAQAYALTAAVAKNLDKVAAVEPSLKVFQAKDMAIQVGVPIHPGSLKFFKEQGWE